MPTAHTSKTVSKFQLILYLSRHARLRTARKVVESVRNADPAGSPAIRTIRLLAELIGVLMTRAIVGVRLYGVL